MVISSGCMISVSWQNNQNALEFIHLVAEFECSTNQLNITKLQTYRSYTAT